MQNGWVDTNQGNYFTMECEELIGQRPGIQAIHQRNVNRTGYNMYSRNMAKTKDFVVLGYTAIRRDRILGGGGGCAIFIKRGIPYRVLEKGDDHSSMVA